MKKFLINFKYAFNPKKPRLILRLIRNFIRIILFRKQLLRYVDMVVGYKCNLKCEHCFTAQEKEGLRMSPKLYAKVAQDCMDMGAVNFSFTGGEPLMYPDLKNYIEAAQPEKNLISVSTNGTLLTYKTMKDLKSWGVDILTISVDIFHKQVADLRNIIEMAEYHQLKLTVATVVNHEILNDENKLASLGVLAAVTSNLGIILLLIFAVPQGAWGSKEGVLLDEDDIKTVRELERRYPYVRTDMQANYIGFGCGAGSEILYIKPNGDVLACPYIDIPFGSLQKEGIKTIRDRMLSSEFLNQNRKICLAAENGGWQKKCTKSGC